MAATEPVDKWFSDLDSTLRVIADALRAIIRDVCPDLTETIKWGNLVYQREGLVCYLAAAKGHVSLGFFNGAGLADPEGILEGKGKKLRHIKVRNLEQAEPHRYTA